MTPFSEVGPVGYNLPAFSERYNLASMTGLATLLRLDPDRKHAFRIRGIDRQLAPGAYEVITDEEMIEAFRSQAFAGSPP